MSLAANLSIENWREIIRNHKRAESIHVYRASVTWFRITKTLRCRCILLCLCSLLTLLQACSKGQPPKPSVTGSERFKTQVYRAIVLLRQRDLAAYKVVTNNVGLIREGEHSGMLAYATPPVFVMNDVTAFYSLTWCAAAIAHDSFHSKLYHDYLRSHPGPVPDSNWVGQAAEQQCMAHQIEVMRKIGASQWEISYARTQADGHYVTNAESWMEYGNRKW